MSLGWLDWDGILQHGELFTVEFYNPQMRRRRKKEEELVFFGKPQVLSDFRGEIWVVEILSAFDTRFDPFLMACLLKLRCCVKDMKSRMKRGGIPN